MRLRLDARRFVAIVVVLASLWFLAPSPALASAPRDEWVHYAGDSVLDAAASADGSLLAIGARDNVLTVYDASGELLWDYACENSVTGVDVSEDGAYIVAASADRQARFFDALGELLWAYRSSFPLSDVAISADGEYVSVSSIEGKNLVLLDREGDLLWEMRLTAPVESTAIYGTGEQTRPLAGTRDSRIYVFSVNGDELLRVQLAAYIRGLAVSRSGARIAAVLDDGSVAMVHGGTGAVLWQYDMRRPKTSDRALSVGMDDQATLVVAGVSYGTAFFFDGEGNLMQERKRKEALDCVYVSRDGQTIIIGGRDNYATVLDTEAAATAYSTQLRKVRGSLLGLGIGIVVLAVAAVVTIKFTPWGQHTWTSTVVPTRRLLQRIWRARISYIFLVPTFALLLTFNYYPAFSGLWHGFTRWTPGLRAEWIGLANYRAAFRNPYLFVGIKNAILLIVTGFAKLAMPLLVAELIFNVRWAKIQYWLRTSFIVPLIVPGVVSILLWVNIYDPNYGMLNATLKALNLEHWTQVWLGDEKIALWSIIFMGFPWIGAFPLLLFYGGLISIPSELFDAAKVDGVNTWQRFRYIDLPLLLTPLKTLLVLGFIGGVQAFSEVFLTTGGGPGHSTYTPALELYYQATRFNRMGMASAIGTLLFFVIMGGTILNLRYIRASATEYGT
jgi:ABC-type sugar transport system permease subunit